MEDSNRTETAPASANLVMAELGSHELIRSNSGAASSLTAENSGDILYPDANARPDKCMAWTDEKHNKYLESLEQSFVQQLHQSSGFLAWCTEQNRSDKDSSQGLPVTVNKAPEQFSVVQGGQWQKRIFKNDQSLSYISTIRRPQVYCQKCAGKDPSLLFADPKECNEFHYEEDYSKGKRALSSRSSLISDQTAINMCYHNSDDTIKEVSDQNFVDEDCKDDRNGNSLAKRLKVAVEDTSSEDQIVPSGKVCAVSRQ